MGWKETIGPIATRMPAVKRPEGHIPFRQKLIWTALVLVIYFFLTNVLLFGLGAGGQADAFGRFRSILAGAQGSLLQLGIGPIVTASIVMQLLGGSDLLGLDTNDPRDQAIYQGLQKILVIVMIFVTGFPLVFSGFLPVNSQLAQSLGIGVTALRLVMFVQVALGGLMVLYMDEIVSKWGIGSGIGLFIVAGVSRSLFGGLLTRVIPNWYGIITGSIPVQFFSGSGVQTLIFGPGNILAIFTTVFIFVVVVYAESTRVEIPVSHSNRKAGGGRYPVKLIYASVLPMILVRALQANIQFIGRILHSSWPGMPVWLGEYTRTASGNLVVTDGFFYLVAPIQSPNQWMWWIGTTTQEPLMIIARVAIDLLIMTVGGAIFALFWIKTTGMDSEAVAERVQNADLQVPGFRSNPQMIKKVFERYIPYVAIIGGALVGVLAVMANMLGTIGGVTGTGLLLMVSITYKLSEEIAEEKMKDAHPMIRDFLG